MLGLRQSQVQHGAERLPAGDDAPAIRDLASSSIAPASWLGTDIGELRGLQDAVPSAPRDRGAHATCGDRRLEDCRAQRTKRLVHRIGDGRRRPDRAVLADALMPNMANGEGVSMNSSFSSGIAGAVGTV